MSRMRTTVTIARPIEEVFRFFLDLKENAPKTDPSVEYVVKTPEARPNQAQHSGCGNARSESSGKRPLASPRSSRTA